MSVAEQRVDSLKKGRRKKKEEEVLQERRQSKRMDCAAPPEVDIIAANGHRLPLLWPDVRAAYRSLSQTPHREAPRWECVGSFCAGSSECFGIFLSFSIVGTYSLGCYSAMRISSTFRRIQGVAWKKSRHICTSLSPQRSRRPQYRWGRLAQTRSARWPRVCCARSRRSRSHTVSGAPSCESVEQFYETAVRS